MKDKYRKGDILTFSRGCYSDYHVIGLFNVLKDFSYTEKLIDWATAENLEFEYTDRRKYRSRGSKQKYLVIKGAGWECTEEFVSYMNRHGHIEDIDYFELHLEDYSDLEVPL